MGGKNFAYLLCREEATMQKKFFKNELVGLFEGGTFIEVILVVIFIAHCFCVFIFNIIFITGKMKETDLAYKNLYFLPLNR